MFASGAPPGFANAAGATLRALGRLAGGRVEMVDQTVSISGVAYNSAAVGDIAETLRAALPSGFTVKTADVLVRQVGQPVSAERCRDLLQSVLKTGRIEFDGTKAVISADSFGVLDRAAATLARCPDAEVEVGAHSDSDGTAASNRERTQARADAIMDFMVGAGVKRERLTAVGYGESKPIADNSTEAGKAANRRIEFAVVAPTGG